MTDKPKDTKTEVPKAEEKKKEKPKKEKKEKKEGDKKPAEPKPKKEKKEKKEAEKKPADDKKVADEKKPAEKKPAEKKPVDKKDAKKKGEKKVEKEKVKKSAYTIDCSLPVKDKVFQAKELVEYFLNRIKVAGKTKNLGKAVGVTCEDGKKIRVNAEVPLAKRYLKYLAKKFLKKQEVRDYLRLVAPTRTGYEFKYFKMESGE